MSFIKSEPIEVTTVVDLSSREDINKENRMETLQSEFPMQEPATAKTLRMKRNLIKATEPKANTITTPPSILAACLLSSKFIVLSALLKYLSLCNVLHHFR